MREPLSAEELLRRIYNRLFFVNLWLLIIALNSCDLVSR